MREPLLLSVAVIAAFGAGLGGSFHLDDYSILADPRLHADATRPLTYLTFWLNYQMGGGDPRGYHAANLALHWACVLLLWDAMKRVIPQRAFAAAAIFAVHPFQAEPVNYIFARAIMLATLFCLLSLREWLRGREWAAAAWFIPALLAKEECAAFPLALALLPGGKAGPRRWQAPAAMLCAAVAAGVRVIAATRTVEGAGFGAEIRPLDYFLTEGTVVLRYLRMLAIPWGFSVDPEIQRAGAGAGVAAWLAVAAAGIWAYRRGSPWFAAGLVLLLPSSSVFPAADLAADRRLYLPMLGFAAAAAQALPRWHIAAAAAMAALSFQRTMVWRTEASLWSEAVQRAPGKARPKIQLARAVGGEEAWRLMEEAKKAAPEDAAVASEYGAMWLKANQPARALEEFGRAAALRPQDAGAINNRGTALEALGQTEAAKDDYRRALGMNPCLAEARENLERLGERPAAGARCQ